MRNVSAGAAALELDLHENEFVIVDVDHNVLNARVAEVRPPGNELGIMYAVRGFKPQSPRAPRFSRAGFTACASDRAR